VNGANAEAIETTIKKLSWGDMCVNVAKEKKNGMSHSGMIMTGNQIKQLVIII
jgi:hypothetical protein